MASLAVKTLGQYEQAFYSLSMHCQHPAEERLRVYEGTATPRPGRSLCGLCGELLYDIEAQMTDPERPAGPSGQSIVGSGAVVARRR